MRVNTRITTNGIIEEKVFDPGGAADFNLEVPGTIASGEPIGTGGGGGGASTALLEGYIGADTAALKAGVVQLYTPTYESAFEGTTITIHDAGNGNSLRTLEFIEYASGSPTVPGAYPIPRTVDTEEPPIIRDVTGLRQALVDVINDGDTIFAPKAWSLKATLLGSGVIKIEYTGTDGASGGEPAVADEMDVAFSAGNPTVIRSTFFTRDNMSHTSLNGRLSLVEHGDGCIIVPLTHIANGTWSDTFPVHPNGITVTNISVCPHSAWGGVGAQFGGRAVTLTVQKNNASGEHILGDFMDYLVSTGGPYTAYSGRHGFPMAININIPGFPWDGNEANSVSFAGLFGSSETSLQLLGTEKIYVEVKSNNAATTAPAAGEAKLAIFYRVNAL